MALRTGGLKGLKKALASKNTCTAVFSSELQVSGVFNNIISENEEIVFYQLLLLQH